MTASPITAWGHWSALVVDTSRGLVRRQDGAQAVAVAAASAAAEAAAAAARGPAAGALPRGGAARGSTASDPTLVLASPRWRSRPRSRRRHCRRHRWRSHRWHHGLRWRQHSRRDCRRCRRWRRQRVRGAKRRRRRRRPLGRRTAQAARRRGHRRQRRLRYGREPRQVARRRAHRRRPRRVDGPPGLGWRMLACSPRHSSSQDLPQQSPCNQRSYFSRMPQASRSHLGCWASAQIQQ
mmetsp:Transcript_63945/g.208585  ORF Transcript_63945/g.208585 Transcript_63945/m.208585 type:complete len:237 (-) Transcript_63945:636-1346(-)